jgi:RNA polymerase sigma factor (TIGR02999 family)
MSRITHVTAILAAARAGQANAWEALMTTVYDELHRLAAIRMRGEHGPHTLQPTALVHEAYLRLMGGGRPNWRTAAEFFAAAAEAMRRILVDHARRKKAKKRRGRVVSLSEHPDETIALHTGRTGLFAPDVEALDRALTKLEDDERHRDKCTVVKLRCFAGLTVEQTAEALGKSTATVKRDWAFAKAWLYREMTDRERM